MKHIEEPGPELSKPPLSPKKTHLKGDKSGAHAKSAAHALRKAVGCFLGGNCVVLEPFLSLLSNEKRPQRVEPRVKIWDEMLPSYVGILFNKQIYIYITLRIQNSPDFFARIDGTETSRPQVMGLVRGNHFLIGHIWILTVSS